MVIIFVSLSAVLGATMANAQATAIDPAADRLMQQMSYFLSALKTFSVHVENRIDSLRPGDQPVSDYRRAELYVNRPNQLRADVTGDALNQQFFFDGTTVTLYEKDIKYIGSIGAAEGIEPAVNEAVKAFGLIAPAADLVFNNAYNALMRDVLEGEYIGKTSVDGISCHHLAFREKQNNWQIWIADSQLPFPRRFIVEAKAGDDTTRYINNYTRWNSNIKLDQDFFNFIKQASDSQIQSRPVDAQ